jgi:flagellar biosynthesis anti-sigma factor FlgM
MRIDLSVGSEAVGAVSNDQAAVRKSPAPSTQVTASLPEDTASLSSSQTSVSALSLRALASGETRSTKVEALQQAVGNGSYQVNPSAIADALIGESV